MNRSRVIRSPRLIQSQPLIVVWERRRLAKDSCTGIWSLWALVSPGRLWENRDVVQRRHVHRLWRNASLPRPSSSLSLFFCQAFFFLSVWSGGTPFSPDRVAIFTLTLTWPCVNTMMLNLSMLFTHSPACTPPTDIHTSLTPCRTTWAKQFLHL